MKPGNSKKRGTDSSGSSLPGANLPLTLAEQKARAEQITPEALAQFLHSACMDYHAFEFRIGIAKAAGDPKAVEDLTRNSLPAKARREYFEKEIARQFPEYKVQPPDFRFLENQIVVYDYMQVVALKRDAKIATEAARALNLDTEIKIGLQDMQRALRYERVLDPKFKKLEKQSR